MRMNLSPVRLRLLSFAMLLCWLIVPAARVAGAGEVALPPGVRAAWELDKAWRVATPTRERVCLNGLWRWQPADGGGQAVPAENWGFFKVPGAWPGITDYMQKDSQTVHVHPSWKGVKLASVRSAWYQRELTVPQSWAGRRIALRLEYLNSLAAVCLDGKKVGELRYPGGELDITAACRPGGKHVLSLLVTALPLKGVMLSYNDTASAREVQGRVARRGLCGDAYLESAPGGPRIAGVKVDTSVRRGQITLDAALAGLTAGMQYVLRAEIADGEAVEGSRAVAAFASPAFTAGEVRDGRFAFSHVWKPDKLWDLHTPQNVCHVRLSLDKAGGAGAPLDAALPVRFAFREFWIDGRDFYLNGSRLHLCAVPLDNAQISAGLACYAGARESLERLRAIGINFVYTHNYGCEPGSHLGFAEVLRAADDVGMLVALSQPHFSHYDWKSPDADAANGYARHAEWYVRAAQNHPSVVMYAMSHNATGYSEDMNPHLMDGREYPRDTWSANNAKLAARAEAIVRRLDAGRIVYHHAGGNLGAMHTSNFYPNFVPIQELCDWFGHWAAAGAKPVFTCEYGGPFTWDWSNYRGWYKGQRSFGSAAVPWEFVFAEWNAQFLGERAYRISEPEKTNIRWEAKKFRSGRVWHRWDYPHEIGSRDFDDRHEVMGMYLRDTWRAFRTWGVSGISPWEHGHFWRLRPGMNRNQRQDLPTDWEKLQRPGFCPDYVQERYERVDLAYQRSDWQPTADGHALLANNQPLLACIAGKPSRFTSKDHNFLPGETIEKQIVVINNSRVPVDGEYRWICGGLGLSGEGKVVGLETGQQRRIPLKIVLPATTAPGKYLLSLTVKFDNGQTQKDTFEFHVLDGGTPKHAVRLGVAKAPDAGARAKIALYDPKGEAAERLAALNVPHTVVQAGADLSSFDVLVIGKGALTVDGAGPDLRRVREGLRVVVFEQTAKVLEKRLGFRATEYGLRQAWPRVAGHPLLEGLTAEHLRDWRGEATIVPAKLTYTLRPMHGPTVQWCGIDVPRAWRCGTYGNVASVLIEKPARGNFLPIVDGGFSLQYSPLMEYREGKGMVLFCQLDVTGRTENDPAAKRIVRNILSYVSNPGRAAFVVPPQGGLASAPNAQGARKDALTGTLRTPATVHTVLYAGEDAGKAFLKRAGLEVKPVGGELPKGAVLVVGPGGAKALAGRATEIDAWLKADGRLLAVGLDQAEANSILPSKVKMTKAEHIGAFFEPLPAGSLLAGVCPADVHNRDPRELPLLAAGQAELAVVGNGVLGAAPRHNVVFCQLAPWHFDSPKQYNLRRTFRRTSVLMMRLLGNLGAAGRTPLLERFAAGADKAKGEKRWLDGLYLDQPEEWDDPYRFFRW